MGKIYTSPNGMNPTEFNHNIKKYWTDCEKFVEELKKWAKSNSTCPEAGEEILFPVADGKARYIVLSLKPVKLIHVNTGDAYHYQYVHRLTTTDIRKEIKKNKTLISMFKNKFLDN